MHTQYLLFVADLFACFLSCTQVIYFALPAASLLTKLTGRWEIPINGGYLMPVDGLPYYLSCPTSLR